MALLTRTTRVGDACAQIRDEIRANRMVSGFQVPEPEIALCLGMSRTPVRLSPTSSTRRQRMLDIPENYRHSQL